MQTNGQASRKYFLSVTRIFYLKLSMKARELKFSSTRDKSPKCNILDPKCCQTMFVCHRQFPHELSDYNK